MSILENINSSEDVKALDKKSLPALCGEIREFLVDSVSKTGGHLSSNLGAVELTVALHRVYDTSRDRVVFDVGHQSYVHKLLTGRREGFRSLRTYGGMSGFPKPCESNDDAFIAGHASTSISVALGMARARTARGGGYDVAAVIGDGALTGGLAYEGLSNAGASGEPLVVILNDNGMSIDRNVGGVSRLLSRMRVRPGYLKLKRAVRDTLGRIPPLYGFVHAVKERIKGALLPSGMFDELGFYYLGPIDGHDVSRLETAIRWARDMKCPVLLHVITQKGKGYRLAEESPELYHGVGAFDPEKGVEPARQRDFSSVFGEELCALAQRDGAVCAITAAMAAGTGLTGFAGRFPERFFDVGIAEEHAVAMAAGMAKQGEKPVVAIYSTFLQRAYDMLLHDVALQGLHVVFGVDRAGIVGPDGETHNGVFDVSYLSSVPGMTIYCPASFAELRDMLALAVNEVPGPVAVRYPRGGEGEYRDSHAREPYSELRAGGDICIISYGITINRCLRAAELLEEHGIGARVIKLNVINPLDADALARTACEAGGVLVVEDVCASGCVGERILARAAALGLTPKSAELINLGGGIIPHGSPEKLYSVLGIDAQGIAERAKALLGAQRGAERLEELRTHEKAKA